jgi:hypothetical protein
MKVFIYFKNYEFGGYLCGDICLIPPIPPQANGQTNTLVEKWRAKTVGDLLFRKFKVVHMYIIIITSSKRYVISSIYKQKVNISKVFFFNVSFNDIEMK